MTTPTTLTLCELKDPGIDGVESYSPFCLKVHRALRAAGLDYQRREMPQPASTKAFNVAAQVPVLFVGEEPVSDSTRILARISELSDRPLHGGPDARARAEALLWEELADTSLNGYLVAARWADERNWPGVRQAYFATMPSLVRAIVPGRIRARVVAGLHVRDVWRRGAEECWRRFEEILDQLEARAPSSGWWVGDRLSVADIAIFAQLHSMRLPLTQWQSERLAARPQLSAYLDRVDRATRPAAALAHAA